MVLNPRPNTQPPPQTALVSITKQQLQAMSNQEIAAFAWQHLGVTLDPSWERTRLVTKLFSLATQFR